MSGEYEGARFTHNIKYEWFDIICNIYVLINL